MNEEEASREARRRLQEGIEEPPVVAGVDEWGVPALVERGPDVGYCLRLRTDGTPCERHAGFDTVHPGFGPCRRHGGNTQVERKVGAWAMALAIAGELDITPWDALLVVVKRAAAKSAWMHHKLDEEMNARGPLGEDEVLPGGELQPLLRETQRADLDLARFAKMAVDAGVAKILAERVQVEIDTMARVLEAGLRAAALTREQEDAARAAMASELRGLSAARSALQAAPTGEPA